MRLPPRRTTTRARPRRRAPSSLLDLLLHQSPVGVALAPRLVAVWLDAADGTGHRAPHAVLPDLLDLASRHEPLRPGVRAAGGPRAAWLAEVHPGWAWARTAPDDAPTVADLDPVAWARLPTPDRLAVVRRLRGSDPVAARALLESSWATEAAGDRADLLAALATALGDADEPLLERALDDRATRVRETAASLLDALPGSARAARMAHRLRPLLRTRGVLRRSLEVALPDEPDAAGVRDGLTRPRQGGSVRGFWLRRLAAGAPLSVWTEATGARPAATWQQAADADARAGVVEAVVARGDAEWAEVVVRDAWHRDLLALLPADVVDEPGGRPRRAPRARPARPAVGRRRRGAGAVGPGAQPGGAAPAGRRGRRHAAARRRRRCDGHPPRPRGAARARPVGRGRGARRARAGRPHRPVPDARHRDPGGLPVTDPTPATAAEPATLLRAHAEDAYADEPAGARRGRRPAAPPRWRLSPWAVATYLLGGRLDDGTEISPKYLGSRRVVEIAVASLATDRALLLLGVPGTAKTWVSEHLAAAVSGDSTLVVQGTAGTPEESLRYGWNYARLLAEGPSRGAVVPSPVMRAMERGALVRIEEPTRIPADVQDALISILSEKALPIPEPRRRGAGAAGVQRGGHREQPRQGRERPVVGAAPPVQHARAAAARHPRAGGRHRAHPRRGGRPLARAAGGRRGAVADRAGGHDLPRACGRAPRSTSAPPCGRRAPRSRPPRRSR
ncbi:hypothetical protein GCM10025868_14900 [Angustibacter aerolatus]|uniref:ATPase dynein-related AAA domain-containing protein n=1 Tax=Angustibacter aerolatus TaxID=1162965 RepID=A0ABQ6JGB2_9ACTN|nr:DUF5691 domain-containing protein [Angustibacter aerolatus]GMA86240.1 hypothetical protein GCM10025868_14900 [Angustibacter aerolatus]